MDFTADILETMQSVQILDCTIRDGGYLNNWHFDDKVVRETYGTCSKAGVDFVEIGFRGTEKYFNKGKYGLWRFSPEEDIRRITNNIKGARLALMADYGKIELDDFCDAKESVVELVRIAVNKNNLKDAIVLLEQIKNKGYKVSLNIMGYANYSQAERSNLIGLIKASFMDYVYVADSYGSLFPDQIEPLFEPLLNIPDINVGFHSHNSLQMAFANTLEAIRCGVRIVDSTIYGMGRAAGNLPTEIIIAFLERAKKDKYNSIPLLNIIDRYFIAMQKEHPWGYQLPYMLSGMFKCHPNYAKTLVDYREYTIEDIWKAMEYIKKYDPIGFSKELLSSVINEGIIGGITNNITAQSSIETEKQPADVKTTSKVPYIDRHKDRDLLILANGPSLKKYKGQIDKFIAKYDPVIIGANYLGDLFKPHYHAFNNKRRLTEYIDSVAPESRLLIGQYISDKMVREYTDLNYEKIYYNDIVNADFSIVDGSITTNCKTIAVLLLGVAIVMGAKRVFAVGMDGYLGINTKSALHFYSEKHEKEDKEKLIELHQWCQRFIEQIDRNLKADGKEGIHILTPTSYKLFYTGLENYI